VDGVVEKSRSASRSGTSPSSPGGEVLYRRWPHKVVTRFRRLSGLEIEARHSIVFFVYTDRPSHAAQRVTSVMWNGWLSSDEAEADFVRSGLLESSAAAPVVVAVPNPLLNPDGACRCCFRQATNDPGPSRGGSSAQTAELDPSHNADDDEEKCRQGAALGVVLVTIQASKRQLVS
jgi:hypothetical protein